MSVCRRRDETGSRCRSLKVIDCLSQRAHAGLIHQCVHTLRLVGPVSISFPAPPRSFSLSNFDLGLRCPPRPASSPTPALQRWDRSPPESNPPQTARALRGSSYKMENMRLNQRSSTAGGKDRHINRFCFDSTPDRFKSDRQVGSVSNGDGGSISLNREVQLGRPILPYPPGLVRRG